MDDEVGPTAVHCTLPKVLPPTGKTVNTILEDRETRLLVTRGTISALRDNATMDDAPSTGVNMTHRPATLPSSHTQDRSFK